MRKVLPPKRFRTEERTSLSGQVLLLTLFAAMERYAINVLVEAYEREAQFGLLSIAGSIDLG